MGVLFQGVWKSVVKSPVWHDFCLLGTTYKEAIR